MRSGSFLLILAFAIPNTALGQLSSTPERLCLASDKSLECYFQRHGRKNLEKKQASERAQAKKRLEHKRMKKTQAEAERLKTIRETDCNPRVQRCDSR